MFFKQHQEAGSSDASQLFHGVFYKVELSRVEFHIPNSAENLLGFPRLQPCSMLPGTGEDSGAMLASQQVPLPRATVGVGACVVLSVGHIS